MDGKGDIQVNRRNNKSLEYRLIINLNLSKYNFNLLVTIAKVIGGKVIIANKGNKVLWIMDEKEAIIEVVELFKEYPPLTSRLKCQLNFLKVCLENNNNLLDSYLEKRNLKYGFQNSTIKTLNQDFSIPYYFPG